MTVYLVGVIIYLIVLMIVPYGLPSVAFQMGDTAVVNTLSETYVPLRYVSTGLMILIVVVMFWKKIKWDWRPMYLFAIGHIIFMCGSYFVHENITTGILKFNLIFTVINLFGFAILVSELDTSEIILKAMMFVVPLFAIVPIKRAFEYFYYSGFDMIARVGKKGYSDAGPYSVEVVAYLIIILVGILYFRHIAIKIILALIYLLGLVTLVATHSRGGLGSYVILTVATCFIYSKKLALKIIVALCVVAIIFALTPQARGQFERMGSSLSSDPRIQQWTQVYKDGMTPREILFGKGYMNYTNNPTLVVKELEQEEALYRPPHLHNIFIETFVSQGIFSLVFMILFFGTLLKHTWNYFKRGHNKYKKMLALTTFLLVINHLLIGLVDDTSSINMVDSNGLLFLYIGIAMSFVTKKGN